ncbi:hypothetical protein LVJ83_02330 [Uruburuella testudinis]|uniref:Uncharacterized protein n=1 Tax=Uruburuella testudinis TaxID=1282863 RepID=A0ABY4DXJ6_9NEIS|nr:hypothetical protein [Uruburuella testudinis]UOO82332.1 hypothetical protein LVJ83_02330 [Uruburuella testudinis]
MSLFIGINKPSAAMLISAINDLGFKKSPLKTGRLKNRAATDRLYTAVAADFKNSG